MVWKSSLLFLAGGAQAASYLRPDDLDKLTQDEKVTPNFSTMLNHVGAQVFKATTAVKGSSRAEIGSGKMVEKLEEITGVPDVGEAKPFMDRTSFKDAEFKQDVKDLIAAAEEGPSTHRVTSRFIQTKNHADAVDYLTKKFEGLGLATYQQKWKRDVKGTVVQLTNIVGTLLGESGTDAKMAIEGQLCPANTCSVVLGAHYDSIPQSRPPPSGDFMATIDAPGADDNGSGVAALLEAAKHIVAKGATRKCSIHFVLFDGEEEGLWGSTQFAQSVKGKCQPRSAVIMDQVSWKKDSMTPSEFIYETSGQTDSKKGLIRTCAWSSKVDGFDTKKIWANYHGWGSDHMPFIENGMDAVLMISKDNLDAAEKFGHTSDDTVKNPNWEYGNAMSVQAAECVAKLADGEDYVKEA